ARALACARRGALMGLAILIRRVTSPDTASLQPDPWAPAESQLLGSSKRIVGRCTGEVVGRRQRHTQKALRDLFRHMLGATEVGQPNGMSELSTADPVKRLRPCGGLDPIRIHAVFANGEQARIAHVAINGRSA